MVIGYSEIDAMSMTLTRYQSNTLVVVKAYFERCAFKSPEVAYKTVTAEGDTRG